MSRKSPSRGKETKAASQSTSGGRPGIQLEDLIEGKEVAKVFPLDPDRGISTIRVSADVARNVKYERIRFNPAAEGTIMCGW